MEEYKNNRVRFTVISVLIYKITFLNRSCTFDLGHFLCALCKAIRGSSVNLNKKCLVKSSKKLIKFFCLQIANPCDCRSNPSVMNKMPIYHVASLQRFMISKNWST